ncbi:hypothetical protein [Desulfoscipio sp. XC116]|uniref:hypothetical protein n=1 Tax=Desulfoscipio sp. XC116 TaxID=3144975 RepID=UPI00325C1B5C
MQIPSKSLLVSLGICIGLVFFGANIALTNYNRLVAPEEPLTLLNWRTAGEELEVCLLGENLSLSLDGCNWPDSDELYQMFEQAGALYRIGRDEINRRLAPVQQKIRESIDWP